MHARIYNWKPDRPDFRDFKFTHDYPNFPDHATTPLPALVDLRPKCPPIRNQTTLGSCTGQAGVGHFDFLQLKEHPPEHFAPSSPLFLYAVERIEDGTLHEDAGSTLRECIKSLAKYGVCMENSWPYDVMKAFLRPSKSAFAEAKHRRTSQYFRITTFNAMLACLAEGYPFVFGFAVYESFESRTVATTGVMPMPTKNESMLGGHAIMAVGYEMERRVLVIRNSWGEEWGDKGYFYMPFDFIEAGLAADFWTVRK